MDIAKECYRLIVYIKEGLAVPFMNNHIPDMIIPETISTGGITIDPTKKYVVSCDSEISTITGIIRTLDEDIWLVKEIKEVNAFNKDLPQNNRGYKSYEVPEDMFIDQVTYDLIANTLLLGMYPLITGASGIGKTKLCSSLAKALGAKFYPINCGGLSKPKASLIGTIGVKDGSTFIVESEFLTFFKSDEFVIIYLDELSRIPSLASNYMMSILDRDQSYVYVEELGIRIYKGKNVHFIASANFGFQYADTRKLDKAFSNRLIPFHMNYLKQEEEISLINTKVPNLKMSDVTRLVREANILRQNYDTLGQEISHRHMIDFARFISAGFPYSIVVDKLLMNLFVTGDDDKRHQAKQLLNAKFGTKSID